MPPPRSALSPAVLPPAPVASPDGPPRRSWWPRVKKWTLVVHLYSGVVLCALFAGWFVSGIVMMYQSYPGLTLREKVAAMPALDCSACRTSAAEAMRIVGVATPNGPVRLGMLRDRPVWRMLDSTGRWVAVYADSGRRLEEMSPAAARAVATAFVGLPGVSATYRGTLVDADQWTLTRTVRNQMPLYRYDLTDRAGTRVYVSPRSGEVLSASTRRERVLSWFGAIPHWIYPTVLRRHADAWAWFIIIVSGIGTISCLAGVGIGLWQWRWKRRRRTAGLAPRTPYRDFMMRWHHILGLVFGAFACTWVFSGLMSMNPGQWSPGSSPTPAQQLSWAGGPLDPAAVTIGADSAWRVLRSFGTPPKELHLERVLGGTYWVGYETSDRTRHMSAERGATPQDSFPVATLLARAATLVPGARVIDTATLTRYDHYYRDQERLLRLPVVRVRFDDPDATWMYLDPRTGAIAQKQEWKSRLERWLYVGLHDLDFDFLMYRRPLWDVVMISLSLGGILLSVTGMVIAWRWTVATATGDRRLRKR